MTVDVDKFCAQLREELAIRYFPVFADKPRAPDGEHQPSRTLILALCWMQEVTDYWKRQYETWDERTKRAANAARILARNSGQDPDDLVQSIPGQQPIVVRFQGHHLLHIASLLGTAKPLWLHYMQTASDALAALEQDEPTAAELGAAVRAAGEPPLIDIHKRRLGAMPEPLVVEP